MQEINLLKKEAQSSQQFSFNLRQTGRLSSYVVLGLLAIELLFYGFLVLSGRQVSRRMLLLEKRAADTALEISKIDEERQQALAVQSRLKNLDTLLLSHIFWSKVFAELESRTYKPIRFESLQVQETTGRFVLSGFAPSQTDIAKFMLGLKTSPFIQTVNLKTSSVSSAKEAGYAFNMDIIFDPKLLRRQ